MFKSVFRKFLFSYLLISIVSLVGISLLIGYFYHEQTYSQRKLALLKMAQRVNDLTNRMITNEIPTMEYMRNLRDLEREENVVIRLVIKEKNDKLKDSDIIPDDSFSRPSDSTRINRRMPPPFDAIISKDIKNEVFQGKEKFLIKNIGKDSSFIILGIPFKTSKGIDGGVFLFTPVQNTARIVKNMYNNIGMTFIIIMLPTILMLYYLSRRFTEPLIIMSKAADKLASGNFGHRINVKNKDEVGHLADALNNMAERLQQLEQARRDFIANVSHELRTPLTTILANTQGILDGVITEEELESFLKVNLDETKRLSLLVNELIELSTLEKGKLKLDKQKTDVTEMIENVIKQMELKVFEKTLKLNVNIENNLVGELDKNRIRQVMINLIDNAIKYTPAGGEISIIVCKEDDCLKIEVSDTGCGITKEHLSMIFKRFYKIGENKGAGIGLSISKLIIEAHEGKVWAQSEENKGTSFFIEIPM